MHENIADYNILKKVDIETVINDILEMGIKTPLNIASIALWSDW